MPLTEKLSDGKVSKYLSFYRNIMEKRYLRMQIFIINGEKGKGM